MTASIRSQSSCSRATTPSLQTSSFAIPISPSARAPLNLPAHRRGISILPPVPMTPKLAAPAAYPSRPGTGATRDDPPRTPCRRIIRRPSQRPIFLSERDGARALGPQLFSDCASRHVFAAPSTPKRAPRRSRHRLRAGHVIDARETPPRAPSGEGACSVNTLSPNPRLELEELPLSTPTRERSPQCCHSLHHSAIGAQSVAALDSNP